MAERRIAGSMPNQSGAARACWRPCDFVCVAGGCRASGRSRGIAREVRTAPGLPRKSGHGVTRHASSSADHRRNDLPNPRVSGRRYSVGRLARRHHAPIGPDRCRASSALFRLDQSVAAGAIVEHGFSWTSAGRVDRMVTSVVVGGIDRRVSAASRWWSGKSVGLSALPPSHIDGWRGPWGGQRRRPGSEVRRRTGLGERKSFARAQCLPHPRLAVSVWTILPRHRQQ
jgi:hypothetical protein